MPLPEKDGLEPLPAKIPRVDQDPNSSDHVVATTQLKEKIALLQKQLSMKDSQLLAKDRQVCHLPPRSHFLTHFFLQITELKAANFTTETEFRSKIKKIEKEAFDKVDGLTSKVKTLQKELATMSKSTGNRKMLSLARERAEANSGSGTDSPSLS